MYFEFHLAHQLKKTHAELIHGDTEGITQDEFSLWSVYFKAKSFLEEQANKKASKKGGRGQGQRFRY